MNEGTEFILSRKRSRLSGGSPQYLTGVQALLVRLRTLES